MDSGTMDRWADRAIAPVDRLGGPSYMILILRQLCLRNVSHRLDHAVGVLGY